MRILHLLWSFETGGIETMLVNVANEQAKMGCKVYVGIICDMYDSSLLAQFDQNVRLRFYGRKKGSRNPWPFVKLNADILCIKPDVIHCHISSIVDILLPYFYKKCVFTRHSTTSQGTIPQKTISKYREIFAISDSVKDYLYDNYGVDSIIVKNGIAVDKIQTKENKEDRKAEAFKLVTTGRILLSVKGQDIIVKALSKTKHKNILLDIIGSGPDEKQLSEVIIKLGLSDKVSMLGGKSQSYIFKHLKDYDLFVMGSLCEGFGLSIVEAQAAMLSVIVPNIEGPMEVIDKGKYGHYYQVGDSNDLAKAIDNIIDNPDALSFVEAARDNVVSKYSVSKTAADYLKYYSL